MASRRRPWLAAVLGFLVPGLGHLYAGRLRSALPLLFLYTGAELTVLSLFLIIPIPVVNILVPLTLAIAARILVARDAASVAHAFAAGDPVPAYSRWYSCLAAYLLLATVLAPRWAYMYRTTVAQAFTVPTGSMNATLLRGDHVYVAKWVYGWREPRQGRVLFGERPPRRGDVAAYLFPEDPSRAFLHRVLGLPGETVEIRETKVIVNGQPLDEPYAQFIQNPHAPVVGRLPDNWGPRLVPVDGYFMLGDNRDNSRDSRFWGFVKQDALLGKAVVVYWSWDAEAQRVRWKRIGHRIE